MYSLRDFGEVLATTGRLLTFRRAVPDLRRLGPLYLAFGLTCAWLAGIGRNLDNPYASPWRQWGLDSVVYVFVFATFLWLILWPMRPDNWRYFNVLVFVALTSPPAFLYALPHFLMPTDPAALLRAGDFSEKLSNIRGGLLLIVALWRIGLLGKFLFSVGGLRCAALTIALFFPLVFIVVALTSLNLDQVVFNLMAANDPLTADSIPPNTGSFVTLFLLSILSLLAFPFLLMAYLAICWLRQRRRARRRAPPIKGAPL